MTVFKELFECNLHIMLFYPLLLFQSPMQLKSYGDHGSVVSSKKVGFLPYNHTHT